MTVQAVTRKAGPTPGNGVAIAFPFFFKVFAAGDLLVQTTVIADGTTATLVLNDPLGYTVVLNPDQNANPGGSITYNPAATPMPATKALTISSVMPQVQGTHIINGGSFFANNLEDADDRNMMAVQDLAVKVNASLQFPSVDGVLNATLPAAAQRASKVIGFDALGNVLTYAASSAVTDAGSVNFLPPGTGGASRTTAAKLAEIPDPQDWGGTGDGFQLRMLKAAGAIFFDDFLRGNTLPGNLGIPKNGALWPYQLLGINTAAPATQTNISAGRWVSNPGDITYATQTFAENVAKIGMTVSWAAGNAGASPGAAAMLITPAKAAGQLAQNAALHLILQRTGWTLQIIDTGVFTTIASGTFTPTLSLNTPYSFEVNLGVGVAHYNMNGQTGSCADARFSSKIGKFATWEHYYATVNVAEVVRFEEIWAGASSLPKTSLYEDGTGVVFANGVALTTVSGATRNFYAGGASGYNWLNAAGLASLMTLSNTGQLSATLSITAGGAITAAPGSGYYLGGGLLALIQGTTLNIYAASSGLTIYDNTGANARLSITAAGLINLYNKLYPSTDAAATQSACGIYAGNGVPNNANGVNGDYYLRGDGGAGTRLYHKEVGVWVATAA